MFELRLYEGGFLIRYPEKGDFYKLPPYNNQKKLFEIFREFKQWNKILGVENVSMLNDIVRQGKMDEYMRIAEALQADIAHINDLGIPRDITFDFVW